eukprot:gene40219-33498_t
MFHYPSEMDPPPPGDAGGKGWGTGAGCRGYGQLHTLCVHLSSMAGPGPPPKKKKYPQLAWDDVVTLPLEGGGEVSVMHRTAGEPGTPRATIS